jgi:hypothetical protein
MNTDPTPETKVIVIPTPFISFFPTIFVLPRLGYRNNVDGKNGWCILDSEEMAKGKTKNK